jgi:hypothetical protein
MKSGTTPGATGVTSDMLNALPDDARSYIAHIIRCYWKGEINPEEWHIKTLILLYKCKGHQNDLSNWKGIFLKEMTAKGFSSITAVRLITVIDTAKVAEQFATIGCQEAIHTLRAALSVRRLHGKEMCVLFIDLVKAYNTVNHDLLFKILGK